MRDKSSYNTEGLKRLSSKNCAICNISFEGVGQSKYCSKTCADKKYMEKNRFSPEFRIKRLMHMARSRAKSTGIPFDLDIEYLMHLWNKNNGCCEILKIPFDLATSEIGKVNPFAPSIDKIIPSEGYVKGNVRIIVYQLNVVLSEFGLEQFDKLVQIYNVSAR